MASDNAKKSFSDELAQKRTEMASQRTLWAADRTYIAWLRTAISMIGFGFAIGKAGDALADGGIYADSYSLQLFGSAFIALAILGLTGALIQEIRIARRLADQGYPGMEPIPLGMTMGILVLIVGIVGVVLIFL